MTVRFDIRLPFRVRIVKRVFARFGKCLQHAGDYNNGHTFCDPQKPEISPGGEGVSKLGKAMKNTQAIAASQNESAPSEAVVDETDNVIALRKTGPEQSIALNAPQGLIGLVFDGDAGDVVVFDLSTDEKTTVGVNADGVTGEIPASAGLVMELEDRAYGVVVRNPEVATFKTTYKNTVVYVAVLDEPVAVDALADSERTDAPITAVEILGDAAYFTIEEVRAVEQAIQVAGEPAEGSTGGASVRPEYGNGDEEIDEPGRASKISGDAAEISGGGKTPAESGSEDSVPEEELNDALVLGPETPELLEFYDKPATFLMGELWGKHDRRNTQDGKWQSATIPWGGWINGGGGDAPWGFTRHTENKHKEGVSVVLGSSIGGARKAKAMDEMFALGLDIDSGANLVDVIKTIREKNLLALIYTSHSHGKNGLEIQRDEVMRKLKITTDPTLQQVQLYLRDHSKSRYEEDFIARIKIIDGKHQTPDGVQIALDTPPLDKFRIIFPLAEAVKLIDLAPTQHEALEIWEDKITGMAWEALGVHFDTSCTDPSRLFFTARHAPESEWECLLLRGAPLKFEDVPTYKKHLYTKHREKLNAYEMAGGDDDGYQKAPTAVTPSGKSLNDWHFGKGGAKDRFMLATLLEDTVPDKIRHAGNESQGHVHCECPFEHQHTKEGGTATMAVDALDSQNEFWTIWCRHDSCQGRHKLQFLEEMLAQDWFEEEVLFDEDGLYLLEPGEEVEPESNIDNDELEAECSKFDKKSKSHEIRKMLARLIEAGIDETDQGRVTELLAKNTILDKTGVKKLWKKAFEAYEKKEADKRRRQSANKVMPDLVPLDAATILTVNAAAENSKWLPGGTIYQNGWFGEMGNKTFYRTCRAFEVVYCADGDSGSGRVGEITIRYPHRSGRMGIVESTYSLGETHRDSGAILGRIVDEGLETYPQAKSENLMTLLRSARGREAVLVEKSGWNEDRTAYVVPTGEVITDDDQTYVLPKKMRVSDKKAGSLDIWVENVSTALHGRNGKYFLPGLLIGAVGCLLHFLDADMSAILTNEGTSNRGKSTALKGGVSWWAIASSEGLLVKGDVTDTGIEMTLAKANGCAVVSDEDGTSTTTLENRQARFLKVAEGQGRVRGKSDGSVRDVTTWSTCYGASTEMGFVRSMEKAMANEPSLHLKTGAVSRIVSINYDNSVELNQADDAAELAAYGVLAGGKKGEDQKVRAYGWAGPVFARKLLELGVDAVGARVSELEAKWGKGHSGAEMRVVGTMALFGIAAQIAKEAGLFPEDVATGEMLKEHLEDTLAQRAHHLNTEQQATDALRAGIKKAVNTGEIVDADGDAKLPGRQTLGYFTYPDKASQYPGDAALNARTYILPIDRLAQLGVNMDIAALVSQIIGKGNGHWDAVAKEAVGDWGGVVPPTGKKFGKKGLHESVPTEGKAQNLRVTGAWVHGSDDSDDGGKQAD